MWLFALAALGALLWALTPHIAAAYPPHQFWVTDPANHARRWTQVSLIALVLLALEIRGHHTDLTRPGPLARVRSFVEVFGTSSLSAYFLHEMLLFFRIFGFSFEAVWGGRAEWPLYWALVALLVCCTFALTLLADRIAMVLGKAA